MMPMISVIMPVYNTGEVLKQTVRSVLGQSYSNFELLLVDDGSTDESGALCDFFAQQDSRVRVIHQANRGICAARNAGLLASKGDYITFCDHDDLYLPELLQDEIEAAEKYYADMVIAGKQIESLAGVEKLIPSFRFVGNEIRENLLEILGSMALGCVWNILYKKAILNEIRFNEEYKRGHEDFMFNLSVLLRTNVVCALPKVGYIHIVRENMSTSAKVYRETIPAMVDASNRVFELIKLCELDVKDKEKEIISVHGREVRCCLAYAVKAGLTYSEFQVVAEKLQAISLHTVNQISCVDWKNQLIYKLLLKKKLKVLYFILRINQRM